MEIYPQEIELRFTYHPPTPDQIKKYSTIRLYAKTLADTLVALCPPSRELSLAMTKLEECVMHANSAIARRSQ
jgi:hypothetical protein